jgi:hypothetical protein
MLSMQAEQDELRDRLADEGFKEAAAAVGRVVV